MTRLSGDTPVPSDTAWGLFAPDPATERATSCGRIVGSAGSAGSNVWLGIPYAAPPVDDLRWRAPRPPVPWERVFEAVRPANPSSQRNAAGQFIGSEDCLYLNIWAPGSQTESGPLLPVMFWIHGGGNAHYDGSSIDAGPLAASRNVVVVTVNYRLGVFGWFSHPSLRAEAASAEDGSGNYGTLDLMRALRWVRDNIAAFGGDPDRICLFGESAGAWNVLSLLVSPVAKGLFARAIVQSGITGTLTRAAAENRIDELPAGAADSSEELLIALLIADGCACDRASAIEYRESRRDGEIATYLRCKSHGELLTAFGQLPHVSGRPRSASGYPQLIEDGFVIPFGGIEGALASGAFQHMPVIVGSTRDELSILLPIFDDGAVFCRRVPGQMRFTVPDPGRFALAVEYLSRFFRACGVDLPAEQITKHAPGTVYSYRFDWDRLQPAPWLDGQRLGATHGLDVPFVFGQLRLGPEYVQIPLIAEPDRAGFEKLSRRMTSYWAEFAATGDPGAGQGGVLQRWPAWERDAPLTMIFNDDEAGSPEPTRENRIEIITDLKRDKRFASNQERRAFFNDLAAFDVNTGLTQGEFDAVD